MIKYVELTAPEASAFRQAKILAIECKEGDEIKEGDTLFRVQSGAHEINLPATRAGRVVELIATLQENITLSSALLLLETEVTSSTASQPITINDDQLDDNHREHVEESSPQDAKQTEAKIVQKSRDPEVEPSASKKVTIAEKKPKRVAKKKHEQQSLDLMAGDLFESIDSSKQQNADNNEVVLTEVVAPAPAEANNHSKPSLTMSSSSIIEVTVPDIGADSAKVIEILINVGDTISTEDPLITLESDKASMDVPCPCDGVVHEIAVEIDQDISEGTLILLLETETTPDNSAPEAGSLTKTDTPSQEQASEPTVSHVATPSNNIIDVQIPDIGGDSAKVIEILVNVGDRVEIEHPLVTLESDKASMDVPSSANGVIHSIEVNIDQDVSEGTVVVTLLSDSHNSASNETPNETADASKVTEVNTSEAAKPEPVVQATPQPKEASQTNISSHSGSKSKSHASPSIRRFARELGVDLTHVSGSGRKARITHEDVKSFVKGELSKSAQTSDLNNSSSGIPQIPAQDFSKFGEIEALPLNKIKRLTAENLHRSWLNVPHVTHNDESNISDLESFRKQLNTEYEKQKRDIKLSPLAFIVKAVVNGLQKYPQFNSSLEPGGENLIYKKYFNIGIAVETPNGLVVPVVKDADKKTVAEIAEEMGNLAKKARDKKLTMSDMSGACITISSLGGIGGTGFTPIVNTPEVAILGVSRSKIQPVWNGTEFVPGTILPLSLSYDHRVIDGAEAARFTRHIAAVLEDVRRLTV